MNFLVYFTNGDCIIVPGSTVHIDGCRVTFLHEGRITGCFHLGTHLIGFHLESLPIPTDA